ncbi:MAG: 4Fe-4S dicluster domain-containing protein [Syntrophomonadaceae bacterium]|jgi:formate dehydrogenase subunit beta
MKEIENQIREIAISLLEKGQVDMFLTWRKGAQEFQRVPFAAKTAADVDKAVFDEYSIHNLSNSLLKYRDSGKKIGLVVKGCDSRGIVRLLEDNQFKRERLYIVGVCCPGMKDPLKAAKASSGLLPAASGEEKADKCQRCYYPNPVIYDQLLGTQQEPHVDQERYAQVEKIESMAADERYEFFAETFSRCIRCYACRQVCVACNCRTCIFDEMRPQWVGRENNETDNMMYHIVKAFHMAGRCVECGECERVCPVDIPLMLINSKLAKDANEFFGPYEAGIEYIEGKKPALSVYSLQDPDEGFM